MRRLVSRSTAMEIAKKALSQGATLKLPTIEWDCAGDCLEPIAISYEGRPGTRSGERRPPSYTPVDDGKPIFIDMMVSCRTKCPACLKKRAYRWALSINKELAFALRSWMVTLTCKPEYLVWAKLETLSRFQGDLDIKDPDVQFRKLCSVIGEDLTLYLKRLRKRLVAKAGREGRNERPTFRYCAVFEKHKSGEPHIHVVVHSHIGTVPILWEDLVRDQTLLNQVVGERWPHGFVEAHIIKGNHSKSGYYLAKYLSKEAAARVRASRSYFLKLELLH